MKNMEYLAVILLVVGGINLGLIGAFNYNMVTSLFGDGSTMTRVLYTLVGLGALYQGFHWLKGQEKSS